MSLVSGFARLAGSAISFATDNVGLVQNGVTRASDMFEAAVGTTPRLLRIGSACMSVAMAYRPHAGGMAALANMYKAKVLALKGLVRKLAQQIGVRPDLVPCKDIRDASQSLFANNEARPREHIEKQMASLREPLELINVLKVGTIGEVSEVKSAKRARVSDCSGRPSASRHILKTVCMKEKAVYEMDFTIFKGPLMSHLHNFFAFVEPLHARGNSVRAIIQKAVDLARDPEFENTIMKEFCLRNEADNLLQAAQHADGFVVPGVIEVSGTGDVLLMTFVEGSNLIDAFPDSLSGAAQLRVAPLVQKLLKIFLNGLLSGFLHADLHPGNIMLDDTDNIALVDWGCVLRVPQIYQDAVSELVVRVHCDSGRAPADIFADLGTSEKTAANLTPDAYEQFAKLFDVVAGAGENLDMQHVLQASGSINCPAWVQTWQKATNAFISTLVWLRASNVINLKEAVGQCLTELGALPLSP
eukprot:TRINITY_DN91547_c0_g1_i1.p1 TRINITY_DN91547_c0_g1~~TRINITY_DN91547_c0_g1_i1.p1  ORF type:complete len:472 (+),score=78.19 TRINITY_DN91547_c0_g1_i1:80-1495(+)